MSSTYDNIDPNELIIRYLAGEMSNDERLRFQEWMQAEPSRVELYDQLRETWDNAELASDILDVNPDAEWAKFQTKVGWADAALTEAAPKKQNKSWLRVASIAAIVGLAGAFYWLSSPSTTTVATLNEIAATSLPDGSEVDVASSSSITYDEAFGSKHRHVELKGKALFEVTHNPALPFTVDAGPVQITVLGTNFLVEAEHPEDSVVVIVNRGKVRVESTSGSQVELTANERTVFYPKQTKLERMVNEEENHLSWKTKKFKFRHTKLSRVARKLGEAHHVDIQVTNQDLNKCRFTGTFESDQSIQEILEVITAVNDGITVNQTHQGFSLSGKGCSE